MVPYEFFQSSLACILIHPLRALQGVAQITTSNQHVVYLKAALTGFCYSPARLVDFNLHITANALYFTVYWGGVVW
jgi:hypothetical protein